MCHDPSASRVYDVLLDSPNIPSKSKRQFVMDFIGRYHELVDDRIGSRVVDRCWAFSDTYLKVNTFFCYPSVEADLGKRIGKDRTFADPT